jgi:hypothetical protein
VWGGKEGVCKVKGGVGSQQVVSGGLREVWWGGWVGGECEGVFGNLGDV